MCKRGRAEDSSGPTPPAGHSRQRTDTGPTPPTAARPHGRVILNVGGTRFESSRTTLEAASSYFQSLLVRWDDVSSQEEPFFIDADPDAFKVLLSCMRGGSLLLPKLDLDLSSRTLLLAEYLGMDGFLCKIKAKAYANMRPAAAADLDQSAAAAAFDETYGTLQQAIDAEVLPARFFAPAEAPPPERKVVALIPAPPGYMATFTAGKFDYGKPMELEAEDADDESADHHDMQVLSFAVMEKRDGTQFMDAVVQRTVESTLNIDAILPDEANPAHSHLHFASDYCSEVAEWRHYMIEPPPAAARMVPIPPGSVRGIWATPAVTHSDIGKMLSIQGNSILIDGEVRHVEWDDGAPPSLARPSRIIRTFDWNAPHWRGQIEVEPDGRFVALPSLSGPENRVEMDVAFALPEGSVNDAWNVNTKFFVPWRNRHSSEASLRNARGVTIGKKEFKGFVGSCA